MTNESGSHRGCTQCDFRENLEDLTAESNTETLTTDIQVVKLPGPAES